MGSRRLGRRPERRDARVHALGQVVDTAFGRVDFGFQLVGTKSPGAILDSRRLARRANHRDVIRQGEALFDAAHADAFLPRLALGAVARWVLMRSSSTLAGSSLGSCGTSSPRKALAKML